MKKITEVTLRFERETKNTVRYDAPESADKFSSPPILQQYIAKSAFRELGRFPQTIKVTVEAE
jgi:hypothetical protein